MKCLVAHSLAYPCTCLLIIVSVTVVYFYYRWSFSYWRRQGVESVPASFPFGSAANLVRCKIPFGEFFKQIYDRYKAKKLHYVGFYMLAKPTLVVIDQHLIKAMLTTDFQHFTDHGTYVNEQNEPLTGHLFSLGGQKWKHLRSKLTPTFTSGKMKMMFHTLVDCSTGLKEVIDSNIDIKEAVEIRDIVARYATDVIGSCAFGLNCNTLQNPNSEFRRMGRRIFELSVYESFVRLVALVWPAIVKTFRLRIFNKKTTDFIMNLVKSTIDYREKNNVKRNDFMHLLIQLKNNIQIQEDKDVEHLKNEALGNDVGITVEQISAQTMLFFVAGFETSSNALSFCLYELAVNIDYQDRLKNEVLAVLNKNNGNITYKALMEMFYMDQCIQEILRKYPPVPTLLRVCTKSYVIPESNILIERGTRVLIPVTGIHLDPEYYPNPQVFNPERFSAENRAMQNDFSWLPFGEGPRACIGLRFALMQIKVALAVLIKDYEFSLCDKTQIPLVISTASFTMAPASGIWLKVEKR